MYAEYRQGIEERKARLKDIKQRESVVLAAIRQRWEAKRRELERMSIDKRKRRGLIQFARKREVEELAKEKILFREPREAVRREIPYTSWNAFLQHKAEQGHEVALAVYRQRGFLCTARYIGGNRLALRAEKMGKGHSD